MLDNIQLLFDAPLLTVQLLLDGILIGAIFALAAYGMALVWGVTNIINIVQGEFVMLGGFVTYQLYQWGFSPFLGIPVSAAVLFVVGYLVYRAVIFRVASQDLFISLLATFGLSILFQQLMNQIWSGNVQTVDSGLDTWYLFDYTVTVAQVKVLAFVIAAVIAVVMVVFLKRSRLGQAIRATAQNPQARAFWASIPIVSSPRPTRSTRRCAARPVPSWSWPTRSTPMPACRSRCARS